MTSSRPALHILLVLCCVVQIYAGYVSLDNTNATVQTFPYTLQAYTLSENTYQTVYVVQGSTALLEAGKVDLPYIVCFAGTKGSVCNSVSLNNQIYAVYPWTNRCNTSFTSIAMGEYYNTVGCQMPQDLRIHSLPLYTEQRALFWVVLSAFIFAVLVLIFIINYR